LTPDFRSGKIFSVFCFYRIKLVYPRKHSWDREVLKMRRADHARKASSKTTADNDPALLIIKLLEGHSLPELLKRAMILRGKDDLIKIVEEASSPSQAANRSASSGARIQTTVHKAAVIVRDWNKVGEIIGVKGLGDIFLRIAVANGCGELPSDGGA
jgi:hypothetical protein